MHNRLFLPQAALDQWLVDGKVDLVGSELTLLSEARKYKLTEAVHVLREVTGEGDPHDLLGRVKALSVLQEMSAEVLEGSMVLGDHAYDVVPGWLGRPISTFRDHIASEERKNARAARLADFDDEEPKTDEDLLSTVLLDKGPKSRGAS